MTDWSLARLLSQLHEDIQHKLNSVRSSFSHPGTKGDASESVWLELFENYLPKRYEAASAHVVDSLGQFSQQIDVVIFDRQYSPFIFHFQGKKIVPAESVYAVFEAKQTINAALVQYAMDKVASVRKLHRTSLPIPHAGGVYPPKPPPRLIGGLLTFESDWSPGLGEPLLNALSVEEGSTAGTLDMGCVAAHGYFNLDPASRRYHVTQAGKPATAFLLKLISELQFSGTVPMIDVLAYAKWLADENT